MDTQKVQAGTHDLKMFFETKKFKISEAKEVMFRLIDYLDSNYDEDSRNILFKNGGLNHKLLIQTR